MSDCCAELMNRLQAAGFDPGQRFRALAAVAGSRIPAWRRLREWRQAQIAAEMHAERRPAAEIALALRNRFGISRATTYRRIASAQSQFEARFETTMDETFSMRGFE